MSTTASAAIRTAPGGLPLVGHLPIFLRDRLGFLSRCAEMDAAVVRFRLDSEIYLPLDAHDIKHVLETNYPNYDKSERMTSARGRDRRPRVASSNVSRETPPFATCATSSTWAEGTVGAE